MGRGSARFAFATALFLLGGPVVGHAQPAAGPAADRIHTQGRYPDDLLVEPEPESSEGGEGGSGGTAGGLRRPVPIFGGRDAPALAPRPPESANFELPDWLKRLEVPGWFIRLFEWIGYGAIALVVGLIVALVALVVYTLFRFRRKAEDVAEDARPRKKKKTNVEAAGAEAEADPLLAVPREPHDVLAREGRYREAIHALLVAALRSTGWSPEGRGRGMTAREITRGYTRPTPPKQPLETLLGITERCWFGGREATEELYRDALTAYHAFVPQGAPAS